MKAIIQQLVETAAPSGYETAMRELVRSLAAPHADSIEVDTLGNLVVRKGSRSTEGLRIMVAAHMDEIGILASHIDEKGFIRFTRNGGVRAANCLGGRVRFLNGVQGVIGSEKLDNPEKTPTFEQLFIDVGATSRDDCPVKTGDVAVFERPFLDLGGRLVAKALDDRVGVAVMLDVLSKLKDTPHEVLFVFTVQEEVGTRGAIAAAYHLEPEIGLSVDVTLTGDTPRGSKMEVELGKGPAIKIRDSGMLSDPRIIRWMSDTAAHENIPTQREILEGGSTDARSIQVSRAGVPVGSLSIPCRYVHSPSEMVDFSDVQHASDLLLALLSCPVSLEQEG